MPTRCLITVIVGILVILPVVVNSSMTIGLETTTQVNNDDSNPGKLSVTADILKLNLTSKSRALYDQVKILLTTDNMTDEAKFNQFKIILAKSTAVLFDKLSIEPPTGTVLDENRLRQKRAPKKKKQKTTFWGWIL